MGLIYSLQPNHLSYLLINQFSHLLIQQMFTSVQFSSVAQSCPILCNPMNCRTPGLPVHHQLPEFTQTHVHRVSDAIQPSHPVVPFSSCPQSLPASESFPMSQLFACGELLPAVCYLKCLMIHPWRNGIPYTNGSGMYLTQRLLNL